MVTLNLFKLIRQSKEGMPCWPWQQHAIDRLVRILVRQDPFKRPPVLYKDPYSTNHHITAEIRRKFLFTWKVFAICNLPLTKNNEQCDVQRQNAQNRPGDYHAKDTSDSMWQWMWKVKSVKWKRQVVAMYNNVIKQRKACTEKCTKHCYVKQSSK